MQAKTIIYVSRKGKSHKLKLRDSQGHNPGDNKITTEVRRADTVRWELDSDSGLSEITGIKESDNTKRKYKGSQNLLETTPKKKNGGWEATVGDNPPGKFENYMIGFKIEGDTKEYWDDPKLQMI